jgi:4-hydroxybutyrate dehydrogenase / sulfolactaldehyde 3-reductase
MMRNRQLGFVGLGAMGGAMVKSLRRAGFPVTGYDMNPQALAAAEAVGAMRAPSGRAVAEGADVILSSLPTPEAVEAAVLGPDGIIEGIKPGSIYIDLSTIDPGTSRKVGAAIAEKGGRMLDVPVGRGPAEAAAGDLTLMIGGDRAVVDEVQEILNALGKSQYYCGPLGCGAAAKLVNNLVSCAVCALNAEAMVLATKAGVDLGTMVEIMKTTAADNRHLRITTETMVLKGNFAPRFKLSWANKDLRLAVQYGLQLGAPTPVGAAAQQVHIMAMGLGFADEDQGACIKSIERAAGVEARKT